MGGCSWCGQLPRFGCWQEQLPGLWRAWHTWHPPPPRPRRPDLELAGACQLPDQNQYTRRLPKFQVQRSPHVRAVGRVRQMGNFWVGQAPAWMAAPLSGWRPSLRPLPSPISRCLGGGAPQREATGHQLDPPDPVRHFVHHQDRYRARNQRPLRRVLCSQSGARTVSFSM